MFFRWVGTAISKYWQSKIEELQSEFSADLTSGLSSVEARARLDRHGPNQLQEKKPEGPWKLFFAQFQSVLVWVLIAAAVVSGFLAEWVDALAIIGIVILNAVLGFIQERRAERSLAALRKLSSPTSRVVRDGRRAVVPSAELVAGDVIELEAGDHVPADGRVISHTANMSVQEASLTGESVPVQKSSAALSDPEAPLAERSNMVFMGTSVASGKARALVVATGMRTELGAIAGMIQEIEAEPTPLQKKLDRFGKFIVYICVVLVLVVFLLGMWRAGLLTKLGPTSLLEFWHSKAFINLFLTAVSLAVAAIPEGLPAVVTIALALGVHRMVKRHALIRKLPSVETLGCATVICTDKTGTLTRNEMTVQTVFAGDRLFSVRGVGYEPRGSFQLDGRDIEPADWPELKRSLLCAALCNGAHLVEKDGAWTVVGDPTEGALLTAAAKLGLLKEDLENEYPLFEEIPFDSERKRMTVVRRDPEGRLTAFVKGAPDLLLSECSRMEFGGEARALEPADRERILRVNEELADQAMRVLALASRTIQPSAGSFTAESIERDLTFLGLVAMIDPPREEAREAIRTCNRAGIKAVMITGDHRNTAVAIGRELGMYEQGSAALGGEDLDRMSDSELERQVEHVPVYARVSPEHKLRIVRAWRRRGDIVAMTGDGVNDAPAVKEADIGVAMGITGTDVTKEVSDMTVTDDNFASIVAAVEEGRGIYDNILKFVHYLLSCNAGEILVMFLSSLVGMPVPLVPVQILWVNLVTDGLPALALGVDPVDSQIMTRPPRVPGEPVVNLRRGLIMIAQGIFIALCTLTAFSIVYYYLQKDAAEPDRLAQARTAAFMVLSLSQLFHAFNCRSLGESIFKLGLFSNMKLIYAVLASSALQVAVVLLPVLEPIFNTQWLDLRSWVVILAVSSFPLWAMELVKLVARTALRRTEPVTSA